MSTYDSDLLKRKAYELRCEVIDMIHHGGSGHSGGALSSAEIVTALYFHIMRVDPSKPDWDDRDRLVLSKGHACPIVYAALAHRGFFKREVLSTLRHTGSILQGHPDARKTPGLDATTGSLGQGLSVGLGMALHAKITGKKYHVYVLLSDGELQEGMVWEAAMATSHYQMSNLTAIVDYNNLQVDGPVCEIMNIEPLVEKWHSFGWKTTEIDGHDMESILCAFQARKRVPDKPFVIICHTVKGKGVSYMENVTEWHAGPISREQRNQAIGDLKRALRTLS